MTRKALGRGYETSDHEIPWIKQQETLQSRFDKYHRENPEVYRLLVRFTKEAKDTKLKRFGIAIIYERMRWFINVETRDPEGYKLNNDYRSHYARLIMKDHPELAGIFTTRKLKSE